MCNCIEDFENKLKIFYNGKFKKKDIQDIKLNTLLSFCGEPLKTYSEAMISLVGQKKEHSVIIKHEFCPFCGEKYES